MIRPPQVKRAWKFPREASSLVAVPSLKRWMVPKGGLTCTMLARAPTPKARAQRQNERPRGAKGTLTTAKVVFRIAHKPKQCRT